MSYYCNKCLAVTSEDCMCTEPRKPTGVMGLIHAVDPYHEFKADLEDLQGWGGHKEFFEQMIKLTGPELIIEVGTWKGKSAVAMAEILDGIEEDLYELLGPESTTTPWTDSSRIVCVDTWLGATEMWANHDDGKRYKSLKLCHGYPSIYYTFLSNVVRRGVDRRIIPFPQTSLNAARLFAKNGVKAQLIYIDASHEYEDVFADLNAWYPLLEEGGIIFGDDYCEYWHGVMQAVNKFASIKGLKLQHRQYANPAGQAPSDYWILSEGGVVL